MKKTKTYRKNNPLKNKVVGGAIILAFCSVLAKLIGALYRIPLTNILGAEGMGMYQLVFPVYALFMVLSVAGIPTALSRIVAEKRTLGQPTKKYLAAALLVLVTISILAGILIVGLSKYIAIWQGNEQTAFGFVIIAPSVLFVGIIAGLRGWFQGEMFMVPTAISNIVEQVVKLSVGIALSLALAPRGVIASVCGALIGVTVSEFVAMIFLLIIYIVRNKGRQKEKLRVSKFEAKSIVSVAFPIALVAVLLPLSNFFDSMIIVNVLGWSGQATSLATANYGLFSGPVVSLINMPIVVIMSLAIVIVPTVSVSRVEHDMFSIVTKSRLSIKLTYLIGVPCAFILMIFAKTILTIIYPALSATEIDTASNLLIILAPNIVLLSAMQVYVSLLQALDKTKLALISVGTAVLVKLFLTFILVRFIGINGAAIASLSMSAIALIGTNTAFFKITELHFEKNIGLNLVSGVIMALAVYGIKQVITNPIVGFVVGILSAGLIYVWLILFAGVLTREDIEFLPFAKWLSKLHRLVRFWEYGEKNETR